MIFKPFNISKLFSVIILNVILLIPAIPSYAAEYVYISDNLRVGVRTEPVSSIPPIGVVFTGMKLEVLEKKEGYLKIKSDKNLTGWIKDIYVTKDAPAIIQLNLLKKKYEKLNAQLAEGSDTSQVLEKANQALSEEIDELKEAQRDWRKERARLIASQYNDSSWFWIIVTIILVIASFIGGALWYRVQAMKKLGGLRV